MEYLFDHKNEWSTDTGYNLDESQEQAKWEKPDIKDHIIQGFILMKFPEKANP